MRLAIFGVLYWIAVGLSHRALRLPIGLLAMNLFANLRQRFTDNTGWFTYAPAHVWTGGAAGATLVGPSVAPIQDVTPGVRNLTSIHFAGATEYQPNQVVLNGMGAANIHQLVSDSLMRNDDPELDGVLPYF